MSNPINVSLYKREHTSGGKFTNHVDFHGAYAEDDSHNGFAAVLDTITSTFNVNGYYLGFARNDAKTLAAKDRHIKTSIEEVSGILLEYDAAQTADLMLALQRGKLDFHYYMFATEQAKLNCTAVFIPFDTPYTGVNGVSNSLSRVEACLMEDIGLTGATSGQAATFVVKFCKGEPEYYRGAQYLNLEAYRKATQDYHAEAKRWHGAGSHIPYRAGASNAPKLPKPPTPSGALFEW